MNSNQVNGLENFFDYMWRNTHGYVYLPCLIGERIDQYVFEWPRQKTAVVKHVLRSVASGHDVHYSPAIFEKRIPTKENVLGTWTLWADFDGNAPDKWEREDIPEPTLRIQSSLPTKQHTYWALDNFLADIPQIEERNRALAYALKADTSGWDANQFLRPPFTINTGHGKEQEPAETKIFSARKGRINLNEFSAVPTVATTVQNDLDVGNIPAITDVLREGSWTGDFYTLFNESKESVGDRSGALVKLAFFGVEAGFTDEQIYAVIQDADTRWEKYVNRSDRQKRLLDIIVYVREKKGKEAKPEPMPEITVEDQIVYGFQEFLTMDFKMDWLLEGLLATKGFGVITGDPGVGKTQLGIQMACSLALGEDFVGWKNTGGRKKIMFLSLEMSKEPLSHFMKLIAHEYQGDATRQTLDQNFKVVPIGEGIPFDRPEGQKFIDSLLAEYMPDVLFIDSYQKVLSKELTDEVGTRAFTEYLKKYVRHKYNCAVYMIHHNRKGQSDNRSPATLNDMYGSRFLSAELDFGLNVSKLTRSVITVDTTKNRLDQERERFDLSRSRHLKYTLTDSMVDSIAPGGVRIGYEPTDEGDRDSREDGGTSTIFGL